MSGETGDLFATRSDPSRERQLTPLAERMRPRTLDEVVGQQHVLAPGAPLRALLDADELPSLILWGPPGCGKTTLARLLAQTARARFQSLSAVLAGVKDVRESVAAAALDRSQGRRTVLFIDEIHRFNRAQQDALLPHAEQGTVTLVGATTENPSFEVNAPLLSRCRVITLRALSEPDLTALLSRALSDDERGLGPSDVSADPEVLRAIAAACDGDARRALGLLEDAVALAAKGSPPRALTVDAVRSIAGRRILVHDRDREAHYDVVSALIKSLRASDPDAALYWLARMLDGGEDPVFVARRLVIFAS
ncbi:MAG: replication-associated recombination protein A, partial [Myxococcales bacterium]|nr:replication-associated recombination protein A [Myxococcales bacterium]